MKIKDALIVLMNILMIKFASNVLLMINMITVGAIKAMSYLTILVLNAMRIVIFVNITRKKIL